MRQWMFTKLNHGNDFMMYVKSNQYAVSLKPT